MAEGTSRENLTPLEEQYIREQEEEGDADELLAFEKDVAAQRLWQSFQESATAVAHLFKDCQQRAGLSSWVPFHESASAVTQLYRGSAEVCRQCIDCGIRYGYKKRTKDILTWAKKRKRFIRREDLIAFLLDKPEQSIEHSSSRMEDINDSSPAMNCCSIPSPRRRLVCREDLPVAPTNETDTFVVSSKDLSRKRQNSFNLDVNSFGGGGGGGGAAVGMNIGNNCTEFGPPITKRIKF